MRDNRSLMQQMADSVDDARQLKRQAKDCNDCEALIRADVEKGLREQGWKSPEQWADFRTKVANGEITVNDLLKAQDRAARQDERRKLGEWLDKVITPKEPFWIAPAIARLKSGDSPDSPKGR